MKLSDTTRYRSSYDVLGYLLRLMSAIWHRQLNAELATIALTEKQFVLLIGLGWLVEKTPAGVSQKELAEACGCSTALASQVLKNLVRKDLVTIENDVRDARARVVRLSPTGADRLAQAVRILERTDEAFREDDPVVFNKLFDVLHEAIAVKLKNTTQPGRDFGAMPIDDDL